MKCRYKIILASIFAFSLSAGMTVAQVGTDGNLTYTLSNNQIDNSTTNKPDETFVIRNRLDSGCTWTASADALIMTRVGGKTSTLVKSAGGGELFNSKDLVFPWVAGTRVGIVGEDILCGCDLEASFFDLEFDAGNGLTVPGNGAHFMVFNQQRGTLNAGNVVNYQYLSQLRSTEINLRHPLWERLDVLLGFRYVELHEDLDATVNNRLFVDANVDNHLYGGQIGMNVAFINTCRFSIEGVMKAGVFCNYSDLTISVLDTRGYGDKTTHTAALGEIGLMGIVQVTNHLSLRGGYQAMWLDGIAIAGDQIENVNPTNPKPYMGGTLFYHGATAGVEFAF